MWKLHICGGSGSQRGVEDSGATQKSAVEINQAEEALQLETCGGSLKGDDSLHVAGQGSGEAKSTRCRRTLARAALTSRRSWRLMLARGTTTSTRASKMQRHTMWTATTSMLRLLAGGVEEDGGQQRRRE